MKKKSILLTFLFLLFISGLGVAYAAFTQRDYTQNSTVLLGDIKVKYKNQTDGIELSGGLPESTSKGRNHQATYESIEEKLFPVADNETMFTIKGTNTYRKKLYYRIYLSHGEDLEDYYRLNDIDLRFDLIKYDEGGSEEYLLNNVRYTDLSNTLIYQGMLPNLEEDIQFIYYYKLRMWISEDVYYEGFTIPYNEDLMEYKSFNNYVSSYDASYHFANFKIAIESDFTDKQEEVVKPFQHEILPYIESNNGQYIDTGFNINTGMDTYVIFEPTSLDHASVFGAVDSDSKYMLEINNDNNTPYFYESLGKNELEKLGDDEYHKINREHKYYVGSWNINYEKESHIHDLYNPSHELIKENMGLANNKTLTNTLKIFKSSSSDTNAFKGKLYGLSIYETTTGFNKVKEYIPVRTIDGEVGLYDTVDQEFFSSETVDSFDCPEQTSIFMGNGTETDPYLIRSKYDLQNLFNSIIALSNNGANVAYEDSYFLMTDDVEFNGMELMQTLGDNKFGGTFDGDGYKIINYKSEGSKVGMFGTLDNATLKNLVIENAILIEGIETNSDYTGGLSYKNISSNIHNVIIDITITGNGSNIPIGILSGNSQYGTYENIYLYGEVSNNGTANKYAICSGSATRINGVFGSHEIGYIKTADSYGNYNNVRLDVDLNEEIFDAFSENEKVRHLNAVLFDGNTNTVTMTHEMSRFTEFIT